MSHKPRIAIIGGGIFGVSAARELASVAEVVLFERNEEILGGATFTNQNRHHYGYHYHGSEETAKQCKRTKADFESVWGAAILSGFPNYYAIAKEATLTPDTFKDFCKRIDLPYEEEWPSGDVLEKKEVVACFKTREPVYNHARLVSLGHEELRTCKVSIRLGHTVLSGSFLGKQKVFTIESPDGTYVESFDYAVNATYIDYNVFCNWFGFPHREIDFRPKEILLIQIPGLSTVGITVMDKFLTFLPVERKSFFTLGDSVKSCHQTKISMNGMPWTYEELQSWPSHAKDIIESNIRFIPLLEKAKYIESRWITLPYKTWSDNIDDRLTEVISHGSGCWSVFGGKLITAITMARELASGIKNEL